MSKQSDIPCRFDCHCNYAFGQGHMASLKYINKSQGSIILVLIKKMSTFYDRFDYLEFDENPGSEN